MPAVILFSTGLKSAASLPKADLYLDCRSMANPFHEPKLAAMSGDAEIVQDWMREKSGETILAYLQQIKDTLITLPLRRANSSSGKTPDDPLTVCCFCAHGIHRSRATKHILARELKQLGGKVEVK